MAFISVTRLRIRKWRYLPSFFYYTLLSSRQARRTPGNVHTSIEKDRGLVFWTITAWQSEEAMKKFRNAGAHQQVMPKLLHWCDEATYVHWQQDLVDPPDLTAAYERLVREGIVSKVKHPSPQHSARDFAAPKE